MRAFYENTASHFTDSVLGRGLENAAHLPVGPKSMVGLSPEYCIDVVDIGLRYVGSLWLNCC